MGYVTHSNGIGNNDIGQVVKYTCVTGYQYADEAAQEATTTTTTTTTSTTTTTTATTTTTTTPTTTTTTIDFRTTREYKCSTTDNGGGKWDFEHDVPSICRSKIWYRFCVLK
jgi:asparagine N-glycosylation enzyme membrane subunit Stt3